MRNPEMTVKSTPEDMETLRLSLTNRLDALETALDRLDAFLDERGATPRLAYRVRLVTEELVTNTIKYGYDDTVEHRIDLLLSLGPPARLRIEDDGHPFDPTAQTLAVAVDAPLDERPIGGLGLYMVRAETTALSYQRCDGLNRLEVVFPE